MTISLSPGPLPEADRLFSEVRWPLRHLTLAGLHWPAAPNATGERPVILLHGWLDNSLSYVRLAPELTGLGPVWAVDHAGHGHSDHRPQGQSYLLVDYVSDVVELLETHFANYETVDLVGHSLGGIVAMLVAGAFPEKIGRLVMIDSLGPISKAADEVVSQLRRSIQKRLSGSNAGNTYANLEEAARLRTRGRNALSEETAMMLVSRNLTEGPDGLRWRTDPRLRHPSVMMFTEDQVMALVKAVAAPTLLIGARNGLLTNPERWQPRFDALNNVKRIDAEGGHHCHLDGDVTAVNEGIRSFLSER